MRDVPPRYKKSDYQFGEKPKNPDYKLSKEAKDAEDRYLEAWNAGYEMGVKAAKESIISRINKILKDE